MALKTLSSGYQDYLTFTRKNRLSLSSDFGSVLPAIAHSTSGVCYSEDIDDISQDMSSPVGNIGIGLPMLRHHKVRPSLSTEFADERKNLIEYTSGNICSQIITPPSEMKSKRRITLTPLPTLSSYNFPNSQESPTGLISSARWAYSFPPLIKSGNEMKIENLSVIEFNEGCDDAKQFDILTTQNDSNRPETRRQNRREAFQSRSSTL